MRIAIVNNAVPFLRGGAEHLAEALVAKLEEFGHQATLVRIPFRWDPPEKIAEQIVSSRLFRFPNIDRVVALKFPAYYVRHPDKIVWLLHQFRQAYDWWGTPQGLADSSSGRRIREMICAADNEYLREAHKVYTNSSVTGGRLLRFNGISSEPLLPPLGNADGFHNKAYGDYILCLGRLNATKRQHLVVQALRHCRTGVRVVVAGRAETESDVAAIEQITSQSRFRDRITFLNRFISEEEKADLLSQALACAYLPYDEDSYGYVTLEACLSHKPVITCSDSGGIHELVRHGESGSIVSPDPAAIAAEMDRLFLDKGLAQRFGDRGYEIARSLNITWDHVIRTLTS